LRSRHHHLPIPALVLLGVVLAADVSAQDDPPADPGFLRTEFAVLGRTNTTILDEIREPWRQIGGEEIGGGAAREEEKEESSGPSNTGDKVKAGLFSALVPGTGQLYNGDKKKGFIMLGVEVAIWGAYFAFDHQGDNRMDAARDWAGLYAGTSGSHPDSYWQSVGRYMDSDAYNESLLREARALGEAPPTLVTGADTWQWVSNDRRQGYGTLRSEGNSAYDRRDFMILFAVVNRAVSVVDAVIGAGDRPGALETEVMGMDVGLEMLPSWRDPGARWVVSRSF
jgi:hypothetical protein